VGYLYPILAMILSLGALIAPQTRFLLWMEPVFQKGSVGEWIMLAVWLVIPVVLLCAVWRGKMREGMPLRGNAVVYLILVGLPLVNLAFTLIHGIFQVLWLEAIFAAVQIALVLSVHLLGKRQAPYRVKTS
jgi:hypothetical protein